VHERTVHISVYRAHPAPSFELDIFWVGTKRDDAREDVWPTRPEYVGAQYHAIAHFDGDILFYN
jgi:hypothetical protein